LANISVKHTRYSNLLKRLMPNGLAWLNKNIKGQSLNELLDAATIEFARVDDRGIQLIDELDPNKTVEMIEDWERLLGLPDECDNVEDPTLQERRSRITQVLTTRGGQNIEFYKTIVSNFGFDPAEITIEEPKQFKAGMARAGDPLTNGDWIYAIIVKAPADVIVKFRAGLSTAGDRLVEVGNETLECLMQKYKPAHTILIFSFGNT